MQRLRIGVLMGGKSIEREVSFNSGRTICDHLDTTLYDVIPLFQSKNDLFLLPWHFLHRGKITDFTHRLKTEAKKIIWDDLQTVIDFIYIAQHGRYAEDGILQGFLEVLSIPYLGSCVLSSAISMNKVIQKKLLCHANICVPEQINLTPKEIKYYTQSSKKLLTLLAQKNIPLPVIIKPYNEGSSLGISYVNKKKDLINAIQNASTIHDSCMQTVVIEQYITGKEFTCVVLTDNNGNYTPLSPTEIIPEAGTNFFDYEQKYMPGRATKFTPARFEKKTITRIQETCVAVMQTLNFATMGRIDGFVKDTGDIVIIDPNTLSGMGPSSFIFNQAAENGMNHTQLINYLVKTELLNYGIDMNKYQKNIIRNFEKKMRIAVLFGGDSNEREISLESGRNVVYKLSKQTYDVIPIFADQDMKLHTITNAQLVRNSTKEITASLTKDQIIAWNDLPQTVDFVFIALHGGKGENGSVQGTLKMLELPYNGSSVLCSALCMDKFKTNEFLYNEDFDIPQHKLVYKNDRSRTVSMPFPLIAKPHNDGCSIFVQKVTNQKELEKALNTIFEKKEHALIEEYIHGTELTVGVIGNDNPQVLPPTEVIRKHDILSLQEKFLPGSGENQTPATLPKHALQLIKQTIKKAYIALNCKGYARIDCFYQTKKESPTKKERVVIIEVNTLPALTPATCIFHQAAEIGMRPMDFIDHIIELGLQEHSIVKEKQNSLHGKNKSLTS